MTPTANPAIGMPRPETHSETSSSVRERLVFIDFRCTFLGELRRADLMQRFGIGSAAATRDIAQYRGAMGGARSSSTPFRRYRLWLQNTPILYGIANAHLAPGYKP
jgi:hypothetical protein